MKNDVKLCSVIHSFSSSDIKIHVHNRDHVVNEQIKIAMFTYVLIWNADATLMLYDQSYVDTLLL